MSSRPKSFSNRRARFDYQLDKPLLAGVALMGGEVKSIRLGRASLTGSFVSLKDDQLWLNNLQIEPSPNMKLPSDNRRARKLLITKKQLAQFTSAKEQGRTIVPLEIISGKYIKIRIAVGKGRKRYDKRQLLKQRSHQRDIDRGLKA